MPFARTCLLLVLIAVSGCADKRILRRAEREKPKLLFDEPRMVRMGVVAYDNMLDRYALIKEGPEYQMIQRVGKKIAAVTGKDYTWEFKLVDSIEVNACCMPGGKVAIFKGILDVCEGEDGLAVVMAHEIAHATLQHSNETLSTKPPVAQQVMEFPVTLTLESWKLVSPLTRKVVVDALGLGNVFSNLHGYTYNHQHEYEADEIGLAYVHAAGYDVDEAPKFWRRMGAVLGPLHITDSLSSHPSPEDRAQRLEMLAKELKATKERGHGELVPFD